MLLSVASFEKILSVLFFLVKPNDPKSAFSSSAGPDAFDVRYRVIALNLLRSENNVFGAFREDDMECGNIADDESGDETGKSEQPESRPGKPFWLKKSGVEKYYIALRHLMKVMKYASSASTVSKLYEAKRAIGTRKKKISWEDVAIYVTDRAQKLLTRYLLAGSRYPSQIFLETIVFAYTKWSDITSMDADQ